MELVQLRKYMLAKKGTTEDRPFDFETLVFRVMGKMFALTSDDLFPPSINLKCDPDHALALRAQYPAVQPGYHMNKRHWNTVKFDGSIPEEEIFEMIDESYDLVAQGLSREEKTLLKGL